MKEFKVELGGKARLLRYSSRDGRALFSKFGKPLGDLIWQDVMGFTGDFTRDAEGKPQVKFSTGNPVAQFEVLSIGLKNGGVKNLEDAMLDGWLTEILDRGGSVGDVYIQAGKAMLYSGVVTGERLDFDEEVKARMEAYIAEAKGGDAATSEATAGPEGNAPEPATVTETVNP